MDYLASSHKLDKERQQEHDEEFKLLTQSFKHAFQNSGTEIAKKWLVDQGMYAIPIGSEYPYMVGYQNAIKYIVGLIDYKE